MNHTVKQSLYQLKRHFGVSAILHTRSVQDVINDFTGEQTVTTESRPIKAVLLPAEYTVQERLGGGASSRYTGDLQVGDREFIIDQKFIVKAGDYIIFLNKRFDVIELSDYEGLAYYALVRNVQNESPA